ncbi:MAG: hypothetical protein AMR96_03025 [Candidatus Adiutrix intracellularis]|nr:MAG: hypothetical protein AMR96_03025 [Candidatus Adiutrix intracellularis]
MHVPYTKHEQLTGLFLLAGFLFIFAVALLIGGGHDWFHSYSRYYVIYNNGYGLEPGVKVKFLRTDIGLVTSMELTENNKVKVHLSIKTDFAGRIKTDSVASVNSPTFIGSEFIDIIPGSAKTSPIPKGGQIPAVERKSLSEYIEDLHLDTMLVQVENTMTNVANLTYQLQDPAGPFLDTLADVHRMTGAMAGGQGTFGRLLYSNDAYDKLKLTLDDIKSLTGNLENLSNALGRSIPPLINRVGIITSQIEQATRIAPEIARGASEELRNASQVLESIKRNFLIRGNLPQNPTPETQTVPARQR